MNVVVDLITGVWVEVVATMGAGAVEFTGAIRVVGTGWVSILTSYFLWQAHFLPCVTCLGSQGFSNHWVGAW